MALTNQNEVGEHNVECTSLLVINVDFGIKTHQNMFVYLSHQNTLNKKHALETKRQTIITTVTIITNMTMACWHIQESP